MDKQTLKNELARYDITNEAIANMATAYMPLTVGGLEDKAGLATVHDARMVVKNHRVAVEKKRKELKEDSLAYGRAVDAEAKRITALLAPIEEHLQTEEDKIQAIKDAIEAEKAAKEAARLKAIDDARIAEESRLRKIEEDRLAAIEAAQEVERERLEAVARKQREQEAAMQAERDKIEEDRRAVEAAKQKVIDDARHAKELDEARKEAAEKARLEAEAKVERDRQAEIARIAAETEATRQREAARPDNEKLLAFATKLEALEYPDVTTDQAVRHIEILFDYLLGWITNVREEIRNSDSK